MLPRRKPPIRKAGVMNAAKRAAWSPSLWKSNSSTSQLQTCRGFGHRHLRRRFAVHYQQVRQFGVIASAENRHVAVAVFDQNRAAQDAGQRRQYFARFSAARIAPASSRPFSTASKPVRLCRRMRHAINRPNVRRACGNRPASQFPGRPRRPFPPAPPARRHAKKCCELGAMR